MALEHRRYVSLEFHTMQAIKKALDKTPEGMQGTDEWVRHYLLPALEEEGLMIQPIKEGADDADQSDWKDG